MKITVMSISALSRPHRQLGDLHVEHHRVPGHHLRHNTERYRCGCPGCSRLPQNAIRLRRVDVDAFVLTHRGTWDRLDQLIKKRRSLTGAEVDELVELYQRVSTHLSMLRSASSDSLLIGRLSSLVARARSVVTGAHAPLSSTFIRFWTVSFPVVAYRTWRWWLGTAVAFFAVVVVIAMWVAGNPEVQSAVGTPSDIDQLVNHDVASYYSEHPAAAFALQVWVNNSWVSAQCIAMSVVLGLPIPIILFNNAANLGLIAGLDVSGRQGRHPAGPAGSPWAAGADGGIPRRRNGDAAGLVGDIARGSAPWTGACRAGPGRRVGRRRDWWVCCWSRG